ncbi:MULTISPECIES: RagB/SusD family nutrient uptake outer membrane protein [Olivibacter]|uniref:RagB/SusD family nutrient uptake outer membrane protein n=1 Tax=Olivibacter jilunii TaxID=985016 RepID=A0ABW6B4A1_9SPHI|nr:RagB/SusD family nutrient uptake outer membrane protein [Pseudosphingobacterium sp.]
MTIQKWMGLCFLSFVASACGDYLDIKPDKRLVVPSTLKDLQAILDNYSVMNMESTPSLGVVASDDYYLTYNDWQTANLNDRNTYAWEKDVFEATDNRPTDWFIPYRMINYANIALEGLDKIVPNNSELAAWNGIKGSALFFRAWGHYQLAQLFCKDYDAATATQDAGLILRRESDVEATLSRSSVQDSYDFFLHDLQEAAKLLPIQVFTTARPSRVAVYALLARIYLQMRNYGLALAYADDALALQTDLLDYSSLDTSLAYPIEQFNKEVIFQATMNYKGVLSAAKLRVDSLLYASYDDADLRKAVYFWDNKGVLTFKGSYDGSLRLFSGLSTSEVYLIKAECEARLGNEVEGRETLGRLLRLRYRDGQVPLSEEPLLRQVLNERRKELILRGLRWSDLRRLNKEEPYQKTLIRQLDNRQRVLLPNSNLYTFPFPDIVISLNGVEQNPRD